MHKLLDHFFCCSLTESIQDDTLLVIGWGTSVKIAAIRTNLNKGTNGTYKNVASNINQVDIVASFQTSYYISGIAPFADALVVLAYIPSEDGEKEFSSAMPSRQVRVLYSYEKTKFLSWCTAPIFSFLYAIFGASPAPINTKITNISGWYDTMFDRSYGCGCYAILVIINSNCPCIIHCSREMHRDQRYV